METLTEQLKELGFEKTYKGDNDGDSVLDEIRAIYTDGFVDQKPENQISGKFDYKEMTGEEINKYHKKDIHLIISLYGCKDFGKIEGSKREAEHMLYIRDKYNQITGFPIEFVKSFYGEYFRLSCAFKDFINEKTDQLIEIALLFNWTREPCKNISMISFEKNNSRINYYYTTGTFIYLKNKNNFYHSETFKDINTLELFENILISLDQ